MTRKLLPYEYDLIDALGVTKEEYLDFVAQQHIYQDPKQGTVLDVQNSPAVVAIVLTVVGILFQVASILLMPKPKAPKEQEGVAQTRDAVLAPRIGFNGAQDLAVYGNTVPLVYTSTAHNRNGGVRVASLLLWSAILSFGNHQFMRLMLTIGASSIARIDPDRTALGQFPAKDLVASSVWQYYNENGPTRYLDLRRGDGRDPTTTFGKDTTAKLNGLPGALEGFSQAFSPTTANAVGVTGFIPVNADVLILGPSGNTRRKRVGIRFEPQNDAVYWPDSDDRPVVPVGARWNLHIANTSALLPTTDTAGIASQDALRAAASQIDNGSIFKAGTALFRVVSTSYGTNGSGIEESNLFAVLECVRHGKMPRASYNLHHWQEIGEKRRGLTSQIEANNARIGHLQGENERDQGILSRGYVEEFMFGPRVTTAKRRTLTQDDRNRYQADINARNNEIATLSASNGSAQSQINSLSGQSGPRAFHVKGLARVEEASYASVTECNVLDLALRFQAYRRISGRSSTYGKDQVSYGHSPSDNGAKARTAMFTVWYRIAKKGEYIRLPYIFCCRGFNEQEVFTYLKLVTRNKGPQLIEAKLEAVVDSYTEIKTFRTRGFCYLNPGGPLITLDAALTDNPDLEVYFNGPIYRDQSGQNYPPFDKSPADTSEFDLFNYDAFSTTAFSFDSSAEVKVTAVTEQRIEEWSTYSQSLYKKLSNLALHVVSGSGTQDLRSVSAYVTEGKRVRLLPTTQGYFGNEAIIGDANDLVIDDFAKSKPSNSTSFASDIFVDTVLDSANGIGRYATLHSVDMVQLAQSKRFCQRNKLFMDGVIADGRPWREFWAQVAPFSLLELGKIGGKETLIPALPYIKSSGRMTRNVSITALFNQGNILEDTFKEEFIDYGASVQDVVITLIYRDVERGSVFPRNNSVEVRRTDTDENNAIRESIDLSQFVTTRAQAVLLGKYLCNIRRYNRRAIEFMTFPTDIFVMPGSYIYVQVGNSQWESIYTGRIESGGALNTPLQGIPNGTYNVLTYGSSDGTRSFNSVAISDNTAPALASRAGDLFVLGQAVQSKRVFRVTEVTMEEEGETTVRAVEHPCDVNGNSLIANGISSYVAGVFTIDGRAE